MKISDTYAVMEMLRCKVSLFSSVFSRDAKCYSLGSVLKRFASSRYAKTIREARGYLRDGDEEMYKACKSMLPVVAFCGVFKDGHSKANLVRYNNIVIIDIDHLSDEKLPSVARQLQQDEYIFAYWKSPSEHGLKALVRISEVPDQKHIDEHHRQAFRQLTDRFRTQYSIDIDQSGSDYSRLCYACWDVDLAIKEKAKIFEVEKHPPAPLKGGRVETEPKGGRVETELKGGRVETEPKGGRVEAEPTGGRVEAEPKGGRVETEPKGERVEADKKESTHKSHDRQSDIATVRDIIRYLRITGRSITNEYENWVRVAYAIAATFTPKRGEPFFLLLSQQDADKFDPDACRKLLDYCYDHNNGQVSIGTIVYLAQKEGYRKEVPFEEMTASDFLDVILASAGSPQAVVGKRADEAMYYLLHERLNGLLRNKFKVYGSQLMDEFEDVIEDFFLYLREGKDGRDPTPYQSLHRIRNKDSFEAWIVSTFRNYLTVRAAAEGQMTTAGLYVEHVRSSSSRGIPTDTDATSSIFTDERKLAIASHLIAFAHQVFYPRSRFIFLRSLLTLLNKQQALPNEEMAKALGMTDISYRVSVHRMKCCLAKYRTLLLRGENLTLDDQHRQMAQRIHDDFSHLYPTLMLYYGQTLDTLNRADAVKRLRQEYLAATGNMFHEAETSYSLSPSISAFWTRLNRFLV